MTATDTRWTVVACTAHRLQYLSPTQREWSRRQLHKAARWVRDHRGAEVGVSGMALGGDLWWADAVVQAGLTLAAHVPYPQQTDRWRSQADRDEYARLLALADPQLSRVVSPVYHPKVLDQRNHGMLDAAGALIALWDPHTTSGGTYRCLRHRAAKHRGMPGIHLDPRTESVTFSLPDFD